jgi:Na+-translocating ferredoxin:NAD+ oxidoreductase RnfC subunit
MDIKELSEKVKNSGIVGAGGAGFPAYQKLSEKADTIILNCAECEPLLRLHRQLLAKETVKILSALVMVAETLDAKNILVGVKEAYEETVCALRAAINIFPQVKIKILDEVYPAGDEVVLVYETTKRVVPPGGIPLDIGVVVYNVETMYNIFCALEENIPVTQKYVTVAGAVNTPLTIRLQWNSIRELVKMLRRKNGISIIYKWEAHDREKLFQRILRYKNNKME